MAETTGTRSRFDCTEKARERRKGGVIVTSIHGVGGLEPIKVTLGF